MNLIVTCPRHFEDETKDELGKILTELGDESSEIVITKMPGILTAKTCLDEIDTAKKVREKIIEEPWYVRYCLRIIPIQEVCSTDLEEIKKTVQKRIGVIKPDDRYRITIEKRDSKISSREIISNVAKDIPNKVSLKAPDWIILIEILANETGISILKDNDVLSVQKVKRSLSE